MKEVLQKKFLEEALTEEALKRRFVEKTSFLLQFYSK